MFALRSTEFFEFKYIIFSKFD